MISIVSIRNWENSLFGFAKDLLLGGTLLKWRSAIVLALAAGWVAIQNMRILILKKINR